jgi:hypothetical protein
LGEPIAVELMLGKGERAARRAQALLGEVYAAETSE